MKVAILAGGMGSRLSEETELVPKPMLPIGDRPILWHILKHFDGFGHHEFCVALGYKSEYVKRYFVDYQTLGRSFSLGLRAGTMTPQAGEIEDWTLHLLDTGLKTNTGGRLRRMAPYLSEDPFFFTYGDGVANVNLEALLAHHRRCGKKATLTAVRPPARFGAIDMRDGLAVGFNEKSHAHEGWINGGFMVLEPSIFEYLQDDASVFETDVLERLAREGELAAYPHEGFWQCMDTLRDKRLLEQLWQTGAPPWKTW